MINLEEMKVKIRQVPLLERLKQVNRMVGGMVKERRPPKLSIPAQWYDEDLFIMVTIHDAIVRIALTGLDNF